MLASAFCWDARRAEQRESRARAAVEARLAALEASATQTRRAQSLEQQQMAWRAVVTASPSPSAPPAGTQSPPSDAGDDSAPVAEAVDDSELETRFETAYSSEPVDRDWATTTRSAYMAEIEKKLPATSRIDSFECRSSLCRLEVVHESIQSSNDFLLGLFALDHGGPLGTTSGGFRATEPTDTPDGKKRSVVFIARQGTSPVLQR